jgi:hypothetical protein
MRKILLFIFMILGVNVFGQLSKGGFPLEIPALKSVQFQDNVLKMPSFDVALYDNSSDPDNFKTLKFAHSFPVSITPGNAGSWHETDGFSVWHLMVESDGAYSLNIIFSKFYLPEGARLFIFDKEKKVILGAFTSDNNKPYKKLAISPLPGDKLIIQYEEPINATFRGELEIGEINHDFKGILDIENRWKRRFSQECNVDVNCEFLSETEDQRRAVCLVVAGDELGTGTLLNNVSQDGKPYLLSAFHVYDEEGTAETALYFFNYESPFCTGINGYDVQSVSGSVARAHFDSLDIMLVELSEMPPPIYRPFLAGWDATKIQPFNSYTIHHPNGDTKKISHDTGKCDSVRYNKEFINYGHWKVHNWENGTTEGGSSGAALLNSDKRVAGILSGGNASCEEITYDLFSRFDKMWNYRSESSKQLKHWLDPGNTGTLRIDGFDLYDSTTNDCNLISNFMVEDSSVVISLENGLGAITGTNSAGITEVAEAFSGYEKAIVNGVSIGVSKLDYSSTTSDITVRIYTGDSTPNFAVKQFKFPVKSLTESAMNYFAFSEPIEVKGNFFISVVIPGNDSLQLFQSAMRPLVAPNTLFVLQDGVWKKAGEVTNKSALGASLLMQVMICDASSPQPTDTTQLNEFFFKAYPNPATEYLVIEFKKRASLYEMWMYDMTGKMILNDCFENRMYGEVNVSGISPGIYLVRVTDGTSSEVRRIVIN